MGRSAHFVAKQPGAGHIADHEPLTAHEAFHLATVGGAEALGLGGEIGNFAVGKMFDALLVDVDAPDTPFDALDGSEPTSVPSPPSSSDHSDEGDAATAGVLSMFEKFLFLGDDRNIRRVYVGGRRVVSQAGEA